MFELVASAITSTLFTYFLVISLKLKAKGSVMVGPGIFPAILSAVVLISSILWFIDSLLIYLSNKGEEKEEKALFTLSANNRRLIIIIILAMLYIIVLMPLVGFPISTFIFMFVVIMIFYGKWKTALLASLIMSLSLFVLFRYILHLPMPR